MDPYNILDCPSELTQSQLAELNERPITDKYTEFTAEQLQTRAEIGKVVTKLTYYDCIKTGEDDFAKQYLLYPPYLYYTDASQKVIRRIYGFALTDGTANAHAIAAMTMTNNIPIGGVPVTNLVAVEKWHDEQLFMLHSGLIRDVGLFVDPLGFMLMI